MSEATKLDIETVITAANNGATTSSGEVQTPETTKDKLLDVERTWYVSTTEEEMDLVMIQLVNKLGFSLEDAMSFKTVERRVWDRYKIGARNSNKYICPVSPDEFFKMAENITLQLQGQPVIAVPFDAQPTDISRRRDGWDKDKPYTYGFKICDPVRPQWGQPIKVTLPDGRELDARMSGMISLKGAPNARIAQPLKDGVSKPDAKRQVEEELELNKEE